jgi:hypothetical protein
VKGHKDKFKISGEKREEVYLARGVAENPADEGQAVERQSYASLDEYI